MMADIDYILDLLDWNRTEEEQAEGLRLARQPAMNLSREKGEKGE